MIQFQECLVCFILPRSLIFKPLMEKQSNICTSCGNISILTLLLLIVTMSQDIILIKKFRMRVTLIHIYLMLQYFFEENKNIESEVILFLNKKVLILL